MPYPSYERHSFKDTDRPSAIAERAYFKWLALAKPEGRDLEFWLEAEREYDQCLDTLRLFESGFMS
jgi:hypothetical protein